jgi:uncharacterized phage protein (TIGR01671 family)
MREIKFKAWHKERKEMYEVFSLAKDYVFKNTLDGVGTPGVPDNFKDVVLMQFTGLKDCEGNDIYEGDLLFDIEVELEDGMDLINTTQQVYWCDKTGAWMLDDTFSQDATHGQILGKKLEDYQFQIYGNIYEK